MEKLTKEQNKLGQACTPLQRKVVIGVVSGLSNRQAYLKAGGTAKTANAQDTSVSTIMRNDKVKAFYESLTESATTSAILTKNAALEILTQSATIKITDVCDFKEVDIGTKKKPCLRFQWVMKNFEDIPPEIASCIKSVTMTAHGPKLELYDKHGAVKQLSDMLGWNAPRKSELTGKDGEAIQLDGNISSPDVAKALTGLMDKL